ncbi:Methyltransferase [uncultured delta proteobacterium]|uniref:Methyltransferase n=1 Tax=uncultured delta proteobacterium TaxID=34034 RepID=A0A212KCS2_9DELT|nr:Methyltransferase [uncultured delta proteobacterium]
MRIIAGAFKGRELKTSVGPGYRPAMSKVRGAIFSMLEARGVIWPEARVLDLFAGSGSLGLEALSRGASYACFVELDKKAANIIRDNAERFGLDGSRYAIRQQEARTFLATRDMDPFDVIFIDPPYRGNFLSSSMTAVLRKHWLREGGIINAEVERGIDLDPDADFPPLECIADREYGQTRVVLWTL